MAAKHMMYIVHLHISVDQCTIALLRLEDNIAVGISTTYIDKYWRSLNELCGSAGKVLHEKLNTLYLKRQQKPPQKLRHVNITITR